MKFDDCRIWGGKILVMNWNRAAFAILYLHVAPPELRVFDALDPGFRQGLHRRANTFHASGAFCEGEQEIGIWGMGATNLAYSMIRHIRDSGSTSRDNWLRGSVVGD